MKHDKAMELVAALRSGKYRQTTGRLKALTDNSYCCLGVACLVAGETFDETGHCHGHDGVLPEGVRDIFGFHDVNGTVRDRDLDGEPLVIFESRKYLSLSLVNDAGYDFNFIADLIEKNWERL